MCVCVVCVDSVTLISTPLHVHVNPCNMQRIPQDKVLILGAPPT